MFGQRTDPGLSAALATAHRLPTGQQRPSLQIPRHQQLKGLRETASASATKATLSSPFSALFYNSSNLPPKAPAQVYRSPPRMERPRMGYEVSHTQDADDGRSTSGANDDHHGLSEKSKRSNQQTAKGGRQGKENLPNEDDQQQEKSSGCCRFNPLLCCFFCCDSSGR